MNVVACSSADLILRAYTTLIRSMAKPCSFGQYFKAHYWFMYLLLLLSRWCLLLFSHSLCNSSDSLKLRNVHSWRRLARHLVDIQPDLLVLAPSPNLLRRRSLLIVWSNTDAIQSVMCTIGLSDWLLLSLRPNSLGFDLTCSSLCSINYVVSCYFIIHLLCNKQTFLQHHVFTNQVILEQVQTCHRGTP